MTVAIVKLCLVLNAYLCVLDYRTAVAPGLDPCVVGGSPQVRREGLDYEIEGVWCELGGSAIAWLPSVSFGAGGRQ